MKSQTIKANSIRTICWRDDAVVDWAEGIEYSLNGQIKQFGNFFGWGDSAISSANGTYVFIYKKLGTKGILLKNGILLREINRPYYCSNVYEYPAAFITVNDKTFLVHCPVEYNQLDFEDVETGQLITNSPSRKPGDYFHSRLEISPDGNYLMSKGWVWHPLDRVMVLDIKMCFDDPNLLDEPQFYPNVSAEICTASFVDDHSVIIGSSEEIIDEDEIMLLPPKHICLWDLKTNKLSKPLGIKENFGNLFAINSNQAWDLFQFPKIINLQTGEVTEQLKEINSGEQRSSMIENSDAFPSIIFNRSTGKVAIKGNETIEILSQ